MNQISERTASSIRLTTLEGLAAGTPTPPRVSLALPLAAERFATQANEQEAFRKHLAAVATKVVYLNGGRLFVSSSCWIGAALGAGFFVSGANSFGLFLLTISTALLIFCIVGWTKLQHSNIGRRWISNSNAPSPSSIRELLSGLRNGDGHSPLATGHADISLFDSAFAILLCSEDEHIRLLVRGGSNQRRRAAVTILVELAPQSFKDDEAEPQSSSDRLAEEAHTGDSEEITVNPPVPPPAVESVDIILTDDSQQSLSQSLEQKFKYDWVRALGIDASETAARVKALVFPADLINPMITRAGLETALKHLVSNPRASLGDAIAAAENALEKTFKAVGKRDKAAGAAWLVAMLKKPPEWLLDGMRRPTELPPFGEILDFPIQFPPLKSVPSKLGTAMGKSVDKT